MAERETMAILAIVAVVLYVLISSTTFHFQRFTLTVARELLPNETVAGNKKAIGAVQTLMTPTWMGALGWLGIALLFVSGMLVLLAFGWLGIILLAVWAIVGMGVFDVVWPIPSRSQCLEMARREVARGLATATTSGDSEKARMCSEHFVYLGTRD